MIKCAASLARDTKPRAVLERLYGIVGLALAATLATGSALAADMAVKAPEAPAYQWSGCYLGANVGGGTSGTNFGSAVDPGTYLAAGDAATVAGSGSGGANADGILAAHRPAVTSSPGRWSTVSKATSTTSTRIRNSTTTPIRWPTATRLPSRSRSPLIFWQRCGHGSASRRIATSHHRWRGLHRRQL